ncbi:hypothetical protein [Alkalibacillus haloalkaliphilus]|uniref:hypothetical protein n=1 Tax=Alkalibacillus haloalkaliphilus TaxID=94136 RepID=UPI002936BB8B|nr:hypothetical protein [Alkalibacillus haloalkaliphilus]MDV2583483.1 hypothetical protein [Alkalibacillus haloalkaliphilus]
MIDNLFTYILLGVFIVAILIILFKKPSQPEGLEKTEIEITRANELRKEQLDINKQILDELKKVNSSKTNE